MQRKGLNKTRKLKITDNAKRELLKLKGCVTFLWVVAPLVLLCCKEGKKAIPTAFSVFKLYSSRKIKQMPTREVNTNVYKGGIPKPLPKEVTYNDVIKALPKEVWIVSFYCATIRKSCIVRNKFFYTLRISIMSWYY